MSQIIKIKRSSAQATPVTLQQGELAYSSVSDNLFIGNPSDSEVTVIGGKKYVDMLDHPAGTLTADSAIVVDAFSKIDRLLVDDIVLDGSTISSAVSLTIASPTINLTTGTITANSQALELGIIDNSSTALTISEGVNNYITLDTTNASEKIVLNKPLHIGTEYRLPSVDGTANQALITDGSGIVSFQDISTTLGIAGNTGTDSVNLLNDTLTVTGAGSISTAVTNNTVTVSVQNATTSAKGVASFNSSFFSVSSGAVSAKQFTIGTTNLNLGATSTSLAGLTELTVDNLNLNGNNISATNTNGSINLIPLGTGVITVPNGYKDRAQFGDNALVPKAYVDAVSQGLGVKEAVRVATTANLVGVYSNGPGTLTASANGALTVDGVALDDGDRILVKNQTAAVQNGIYTATDAGSVGTPWILTRSEDANIPSELGGGTFTFVEEGTTNADAGFVFIHDGVPTFGVTQLNVSQFSGAGSISDGAGIHKSGNVLSVVVDDVTTEIIADAVKLKGVSSTAIGDLIVGKAANGGFSSLAKPAIDDSILTMGSSGVASWTNVLDGGDF